MSATFFGYVETSHDAFLVIEGCRRGRLHAVMRRLSEHERMGIRSGCIYVFSERDSGIRRWTDGMYWSPSRILGNFLVYRQLERRPTGSKRGISLHDVKAIPAGRREGEERIF